MLGRPDNRNLVLFHCAIQSSRRSLTNRGKHFIDLCQPITIRYIGSQSFEILLARLENTLSCLCELPLLLAPRPLQLRGVLFASISDLCHLQHLTIAISVVHASSYICAYFPVAHIYTTSGLCHHCSILVTRLRMGCLTTIINYFPPLTQCFNSIRALLINSSRIPLSIPGFRSRGY